MEMPKAILERRETSDQGTFGVLRYGGLFIAYTGELPWRENQSNISCIPLGIYQCVLTNSPRFNRRLYLVGPVEHRSGIRIHPANLMGDARKGLRSQLNGCIALGEKIGFISGQKAILLSQPAHRKFEQMMNGKPFILEIINAPEGINT